jgi:hypothetical protein
MGMTALIFGIIGGLCAAMGVVTALGVVPFILAPSVLTWPFWFGISALLLLICIAFAVSRIGGSSYD